MAEPVDSPLLVVDASIFLSWLLPEEHPPSEIKELLIRHRDEKITITVPPLLRYEIINSLRSAVLRNRLSSQAAQKALRRCEQFLQSARITEPDSKSMLHMAINVAISGYDAAYVTLADKLKTTLYTRDRKLSKTVASIIKVTLI